MDIVHKDVYILSIQVYCKIFLVMFFALVPYAKGLTNSFTCQFYMNSGSKIDHEVCFPKKFGQALPLDDFELTEDEVEEIKSMCDQGIKRYFVTKQTIPDNKNYIILKLTYCKFDEQNNDPDSFTLKDSYCTASSSEILDEKFDIESIPFLIIYKFVVLRVHRRT